MIETSSEIDCLWKQGEHKHKSQQGSSVGEIQGDAEQLKTCQKRRKSPCSTIQTV